MIAGRGQVQDRRTMALSCLWVTAVAAGIGIIPFVLLHSFKLSRCPKERAKAFVKRSRAGPIAHRGGSPENTLAAFRRAKAEGASSVEVDLEFTRDGHPVLLHDSTVDRTSNGSGRVADMTLEEVKRLDFGSKYGYVSASVHQSRNHLLDHL